MNNEDVYYVTNADFMFIGPEKAEDLGVPMALGIVVKDSLSTTDLDREILLLLTPEDAMKFSQVLQEKASEAISQKRNHRTEGSKNE